MFILSYSQRAENKYQNKSLDFRCTVFSLPMHYTHLSPQVLKKTVIVSPVIFKLPKKQRASWQEKQGEEASGAGACG